MSDETSYDVTPLPVLAMTEEQSERSWCFPPGLPAPLRR